MKEYKKYSVRFSLNNVQKTKVLLNKFNINICTNNSIEEFLKNKNNVLIAAYNGQDLVGYLYGFVLQRIESLKPMLFLYSVDVLKEYRKKGYGSIMVKHFLSIGKDLKMSKAFVITDKDNQSAMKLYESCGAEALRDDDIVFSWK